MSTYTANLRSDVTNLSIEADEQGRVVRIEFVDAIEESSSVPEQCEQAVRELEQYFRGERETFEVELAPTGTSFQIRVWRELQNINYGHTISYGALAQRIGKPNAMRAVGGANNQNPIPIIIPCHRVIGSDGSMTGFGGGIDIKKALLAHEGALAEQLQLGLG